MYKLLALCGIASVAGKATVLTQATFDDAIKGGKNHFVKFLAPW